MELELCNQTFSCYQAQKEQIELCEPSVETIVPDYCPDIVRIVDSSATLFLRNPEIHDGQINLSGTIKMNVLYMAEADAGLKHLEYSIPLNHISETHLNAGCDTIRLVGTVTDVDVRLMNPRKVATHLTIRLSSLPYYTSSCTVCSGIAQQKEYNIETLSETKSLSLIKAVKEKDFLFREQIIVPSGKEPISEILRTSQHLRLDESKVVGNKILLKGSAYIELLYLTEQGSVQQLCSNLPFSQMMDGCDSSGEALSAESYLRLSGAEYQLDHESGSDKRLLDVTISVNAFSILYEPKSFSRIIDIYSTSHALETKIGTMEISSAPKRIEQEFPMREQIETGTDISAVLSTSLSFSSSTVSSDSNRTLVSALGTVKVLYTDENGAPYCVERRFDENFEFPHVANVDLQDISAQQVVALPTAIGIDVRFNVCITLCSTSNSSDTFLSALHAVPYEEESQQKPSLVLRRLQPKETLWLLAKEYRTTVNSILAANDCTEECCVKVGDMLLIPKKR